MSEKILKRFAFTLAEVLITLGIIGVVAAITIPTLMQESQEKRTASALKEFYSVLSSAYNMAVNNNGAPANNWATDSNTILTTLAPYIKITKNCGTSAGCYSGISSLNIKGQTWYWSTIDSNSAAAKALLANGTFIAIFREDATCATNNRCGWMIIDINGLEKPNQAGYDTFWFEITNSTTKPFGLRDASSNTFADDCVKPSVSNGTACASWVIFNENMDYLHCTGLAWDGKKQCP